MAKKEKKPIFKRKWFWALLILVVIFIAIPTEESDKQKTEDTQASNVAQQETIQQGEELGNANEPLSETEQIEEDMRTIIFENYRDTTVDRISINPNYGTEDDESDYVALAYLIWDVKNSRKTTQEMLSMYSEDFAARIGTNVPLVSEFTVFWTVPYHDESQVAMKFTYDRKDEGMYQVDQWNSFAMSNFGK